MADIVPFRGIFYDRNKVRCEAVIAPPYDIITPAMRDALYAKSPYNVVRIDAGRDEGEGDKYDRARESLLSWLQSGVLGRSERPAFYAYRMDYDLAGNRKSLTGFFAAVRLVELGKGVYPHEATYSKPKADRMSLLKRVKANTSPVFSLYNKSNGRASAALGAATSGEPYLSAPDLSGSIHSFWPIEDEGLINDIREDLKASDIFIADGHHRYETALEFRAELIKDSAPAEGVAPHDFVLMFLADIKDPGLTALPTHRLIARRMDAASLAALGKEFDLSPAAEARAIPSLIASQRGSLGLYSGGAGYVVRRKGGRPENVDPVLGGLDVVLLDEVLIKGLLGAAGISYEMDPARVIERVDAGEFGTGFFLSPTPIGDVERVALSGRRMPPKSTYFYPKVQTGFVMYGLNN